MSVCHTLDFDTLIAVTLYSLKLILPLNSPNVISVLPGQLVNSFFDQQLL